MSTATISVGALIDDNAKVKAALESLTVVTADKIGSFVAGRMVYFYKTTSS